MVAAAFADVEVSETCMIHEACPHPSTVRFVLSLTYPTKQGNSGTRRSPDT